MTRINVQEYLTPNLEFEHGDKTYTVEPPSRVDGLKMAAIVALGTATFAAAKDQCPVCGRTAELDNGDALSSLVEDIKDQPLGWLTLGKSVVQEMDADGIPEVHQDQYALYALYYWTMGKDQADQHFAARYAAQQGDTGPKA